LRKLTSSDLKDLNLLKHYRIIRKWACKTCNLNDADLELNKILKQVLILIAGITGAGTSC
jgi:hypothetical protein